MRIFRKSDLPRRHLVRYDSVRPDINEGDMLLWRGNYLISKIFRSVWGGYYSHVAVVSRWGKRLMVLHSVWPAVTAVPLRRAVRKYNGRVDLYALKDPEREGKPDPFWRQNVDKAIEHARSHLGMRYNIKVLFINGVARLLWPFGYSGGNPNEPISMPTKMFCSQYVAHSFAEENLDLVLGKADSVTWPQDIADSDCTELVGTLEPDPEDRWGVRLKQAWQDVKSYVSRKRNDPE